MLDLRGTVVEVPDLQASSKAGLIRCPNGKTFGFTADDVAPGLHDTLMLGSEVEFSIKSLMDTAVSRILVIHPPTGGASFQGPAEQGNPAPVPDVWVRKGPPPLPSPPPSAGPADGASSFFYVAAGGGRRGPVSMEALQKLFRAGTINEKSLVWSADFGDEWREYGRAVPRGAGEPPLVPTQAIPNIWFYLLIIAPLLMSFVELVIRDSQPALLSGGFALFLLYWIPNTIISFLDERTIKASGRPNVASGLLAWGAILVPVYVALRARRTNMGFGPLVGWIGAFVAGLFLTGALSTDGDTYWGFGLPSCESATTVAMVEDIFPQLPINFVGAEATGVTNISESSHDAENGVRTCRAIVQSAMGADVPVIYTITEQGDEFYYELMADF